MGDALVAGHKLLVGHVNLNAVPTRVVRWRPREAADDLIGGDAAITVVESAVVIEFVGGDADLSCLELWTLP
jgi:hypothetical protein